LEWSGVEWGKPFKHVFIFEKIFSITSRPNSIKHDANYPCIKGIQVYTNKGPYHLQREDDYKNVVGSFDFFLKIHKARKAQIYIEAS
jgi:hypothetical protein